MHSLCTSKAILKESPESTSRNLICSRHSETLSSQGHLLNTQLLTFREFNPRHKKLPIHQTRKPNPKQQTKKMPPQILHNYLAILAYICLAKADHYVYNSSQKGEQSERMLHN